MLLVIASPYGRREVTLAALRLADLARALGYPVRFAATTPPADHIHPYWDKHVRTPLRDGFYKACQGARIITWFHVDIPRLQQAEVVAPNAEHHILIHPTLLYPEHQDEIRRYDQIICPTQLAYDLVARECFGGGRPPTKLNLSPKWDCGFEPRTSFRQNGRDKSMRLGVYADPGTIDDNPMRILRLCHALLDALPALQIRLLSSKSWPKRAKSLLKIFRAEQTRLEVDKEERPTDFLTLAQDSDWTWLPATRGDIGIYAWHSLSAGTPVMAFDLPPFNEIIVPRTNGILLPCEITTNRLSFPAAVPDTGTIGTAMLKALKEKYLLKAMRGEDWKLTLLRMPFEVFWRELWGDVTAP